MKGLKTIENPLPNVRGARYIRERRGDSPDRTFRCIRKRARAQLVPLALQRRSFTPLYPSASSHARPHLETTLFAAVATAIERPFQPLPLGQPYPWSFHTTPPLAINAREKVGARSRSRPLRTSLPPSLYSSPSPSPYLSLFHPHFLTSLSIFLDGLLRFSPFLSCRCTDSRDWR